MPWNVTFVVDHCVVRERETRIRCVTWKTRERIIGSSRRSHSDLGLGGVTGGKGW